MPRQPTLRKKKVRNSVYLFTKTGGDTYFSSVDEVPITEVKKLFADHVQSLLDEKKDSKGRGFTAGDLMVLFLDWIKDHRSKQTHTTRTSYCSRFGDFIVGGNRLADSSSLTDAAGMRQSFLSPNRWVGEFLHGQALELPARSSVGAFRCRGFSLLSANFRDIRQVSGLRVENLLE